MMAAALTPLFPSILWHAVKKAPKALMNNQIALGMTTSLAIGYMGDMSAQRIAGTNDKRKTIAMSTFTMIYIGIVYPKVVFPFMDRLLTSQRLRCGATGVLMAKVAFENLVHTPFMYFPVFYLMTGGIRGHSLEEVRTLISLSPSPSHNPSTIPPAPLSPPESPS